MITWSYAFNVYVEMFLRMRLFDDLLVFFCLSRFGHLLWWKNGWISSRRFMISVKMKWTQRVNAVKMMVWLINHGSCFLNCELCFWFLTWILFWAVCSCKDEGIMLDDHVDRTKGFQSACATKTTGGSLSVIHCVGSCKCRETYLFRVYSICSIKYFCESI